AGAAPDRAGDEARPLLEHDGVALVAEGAGREEEGDGEDELLAFVLAADEVLARPAADDLGDREVVVGVAEGAAAGDEGEGGALAGEFERGVGGGADGGLVGAPGHVVHRRALEARGDGGVAVAALARADVIDARDVRGDELAGARGWRSW